jgi:ketosteroid isomerase-like protein
MEFHRLARNKQEEEMRLSRRGLAATAAAIAATAGFIPLRAGAQASDEAAVAAAVDAFRKAMQANDRAGLEALCAPQLSYGHSDGHVQTRDVFVADASSDKAHWKTLEFSGIRNSLAGDAAISRFTLTGDLETGDKVAPIKIGVLMVWQKQDGEWKLLARQAFKI